MSGSLDALWECVNKFSEKKIGSVMPVKNYKLWNRKMRGLTKGFTEEQFQLFSRKVALDTFAMLLFRSPVGNPDLWKSKAPPGYVGGQFRGNWQISIDSYDANAVLDNKDKNGGDTYNEESRKVYTSPAFSVIYLHNNLPYAQRLENGWSTQAPNGIVAVTLETIRNHLSRQ